MPQKPTNDLDALIQSLGGTFSPAPTQQPAASPQQSNNDDLDSLISSLGGTVNAPSSTTRRVVGDTGVSLMKGLASIPQAIVGLADIPTGGRVGKALEDYAGYDPSFTDQYWESLYTPEQKAAFENVRRAEGFLGTLGEVGKNFSVVPHSVVESVPSMFLGGAIGRAAGAAVPALEAFAGGIGEGAVQAGQAAEQSRQDSQTGLLDTKGTIAAVGSGVGTGLLGVLGGRLAEKYLKVADPETLLSKPGALAEAIDRASSRTKLEMVRDTIYGAISEGLFEEFPQSVQEQVWANYAANKPLYEGVPQAAVLGALAGAVMGGGSNLVFGAESHEQPAPTPQPPPTAPPPVVTGQPPSIQPEPPVAPTGRPPITPPPQPPPIAPEPEPQPPIITPEPTPEPEETEEQRAAREERERFLKLLEEEPEEEEGGTIGGTIPPAETPIITPETQAEPPSDETISGTIPEDIELPTTRESPADFESVLKAARKLNPVVDEAELRRQFDERLDIVESAYPGDDEMRESGKDPVDLARVIASLGGINEKDIAEGNHYWNRETGELRQLKEEAKGQGFGNSGSFGSFFGVPRVFRKNGLNPDVLVQSLQQFPRFKWIEGPNELFEFLTSEARNPTNRDKFGRPALRLKDLGIDPEKAWWARASQPAIESGEQPPDVPIVTGKPPIKNVAMVEGEGEEAPFGERQPRNVIGSFSLEDAISPEAQVNLAKAFQSRKGARDLSRIRQAMEIHQNLIDMGTPEAQRQANELAIAVDNYFTPGKADHTQFKGYPEGETFLPRSKAAEAVEEAMWDGLKMVTGEEEPDWNQLAEREIIGDANETGAMILDTLDPKTAAFDTELFNSAYSDVEFRRDGDPFPAPKERVVVSEKTKTPKTYITQDQADHRIDKWVEEAYRIGREEDHSNEVIISLFDRTGAWSQPYEDAGYTVKRYDIQNGNDLTNFGDWMADIEMLIAEGYEIVGILGAPPCTTYTSSANRWIERRGIESREEIAKTFEIADIDKLKEKFKTPLDYANTLVAVMKLAVDQADPKFYALENPVGTIGTHNALPQAPLTFDPNAFGDPYEKWTQIWGEFNPQLPTAYVEATEESKMHNMGKKQRKLEGSETPSGFAYAFFMANNTAKTLNKALLTDVPPVQTGKPPIKAAPEKLTAEERADRTELVREQMAEKRSVLGDEVRTLGMEDELKAAGYKGDDIGLWWSHPDAVAEAGVHAVQNKIDYRWKTIGIEEAEKAGLTQAVINAGYVRGQDKYAGEVWLRQPEKKSGKPPIKSGKPVDVRLPGDVGKVRDTEVSTPKIPLPQQGLTLKTEEAPEGMRTPVPSLFGSDEGLNAQQKAAHQDVRDAFKNLGKVIGKNSTKLNAGIPPIDQELAYAVYEVVKAMAKAGVVDAQVAWDNIHAWMGDVAGDLRKAFRVAWRMQHGSDPVYTTTVQKSATPEQAAERVKAYQTRQAQREAEEQKTAPKQEPKQEPKAAPKQEPQKPARPQPMSRDIQAIGEERLNFGSFTKRNIKVKDISTVDINHALEILERLTSARARYVSKYLAQDPVILQALGEFATPKITEQEQALFDRLGIKLTVNGPLIEFTGNTFEHRAIFSKTKAAKYLADSRVWFISGRNFGDLVRNFEGVEGGSTTRRNQVAAHVTDPRLRALREAAEREPDRSGFDQGVSTYVSNRTQELIREGGNKLGIDPKKIDEQIEDVAMTVRAYENEQGAMIIASEPGTGKTFVIGGSIRELLARGAKKIVVVTKNKKLIQQAKENLAAYGIMDDKRVDYITYHGLRNTDPIDTDAIFFDEAHSVKNVKKTADAARQALMGQEWIKRTKFTVLASGTPYENPTQIQYLAPTKLFDKAFGGYHDFAQAYGARAVPINDKGDFLYRWEPTTTSEDDQKKAREWIRKQGVFTARRIELEPGQVETRLTPVKVDQDWQGMYDAMVRAKTQFPKIDPKWVKNFTKRVMEAAKLPVAVKEAQRALDRGRFPVIFIETYSQRIFEIQELLRLDAEYEEDARKKRAMGEPPDKRSDWGLPPKYVPQFLAEVGRQIGKETIEIPPAEDVIKEAFGEDKVAVYLGSNSKADKDLAAWRTGEKPVMVATMGKGGTGLSLHDTTGEHPVTQINVILPWTATSITQVSGRAARYGMKGMAEILWLFARGMGADLELAARVGQRMSDMGALVHGQPLENAQNFRSGTFNDPMFGEIGEEEEEDDDDRSSDSYDDTDYDTDGAPRERNVIGKPAEEQKTFYDEEGEEGTHPETDEPIYPIEIPELVEIIRDLLGNAPLVKRMAANIRGAFSQSKAAIYVNAGLFQQGKEIEVAQTIAHELGHAVDYLPDETMKRGNLLGRIKSLTEYLKHTFVNPNGDIIALADVREELKELSMIWRPWNPATATESHKKYRNSGKELFADAMSALFRNPALLQRTAPIFYKEVFDTLARKPEVEDKYYEVQAAMAGTEEQKSERRLEYDRTATKGGTAKAVQVEKQKVQKRKESFKAWWLRLKSEFKHLALKMEYPIIDRITKKNIQLPEDLDPRYAFSERNYVGGKRKGWVQRNVEPIYDVLTQHDISWTDFGLFLKYEREIKGDRQNLANPAGSSPKVAQGKLDAMMREFTPEQREAITVAADKFRDAIRDIVDQAYAAGIYSTEAYEKFSEHYVTFHVLDYIDQAVTAKMFRQKGTLKDVKNAADASIIKMLVTIGEVENQKTKKLTFNFLKRFYPDEIEDGGPIAHRKRKKNTDLEEVGYWKNGVWHLQYVDPLIADALNRNTVGKNNAIIKAISFVNSKVFRPVFTGLNPGFQSFNVMRDFLRTWKTSGMSLATTAKRYVDGMPLAKVRAFGVRDPEAKGVRESIKNGILKAIGITYSKELQAFEDLLQAEQSGTLSITFNDFNSGRHVEETEILDIMARVGARKSEPPRTGLRALPLAKQLGAGVEFVKGVGDFIETLPKAAAMYEMIGTDRQIKDLTPKERALIRERIGSPDYLAGGTLKPVTNEIWLFSNAITQAWLADYQSAKEDYKSYKKEGDPKTRSGYLWKTAAINVLPKMLMMAAAVGLMGDWLRKLFENVSEYDKTNYLAVPITLDENGNTIYLRLPQDDVGRFVGGLTWKALRLLKGDKDVIETLAQVVDYTSGQFPSVTPTLGAVKDTLELAAGQNPYDEFRSRNLFTDDEMAAGGYQKFSKFVGWEFQQLGGSIIYKFYPGESRPQEQTEGQKILDWPVVSNTLGRWLRISNYGEHEIYRDIEKAVGKEEATRRLQEREQVNDAIREYMQTPSFLRQGDRGRGQRFALARKIAESVYTEVARRPNGTIDRDELSRRANLIQKKIQMGAIRGHADPLVERVMAAQSNLQRKEIIKKGRQTMTTEEYVGWLDRAASNAVISRELSQELKREARVH